jgi:Mlc titration factor MtfA (ptsG expression regulator)
MTPALVTFGIVVIVVAFTVYPKWRDHRTIRQPFPHNWLLIVERRLPFFSKLDVAQQKQILDNIKLFLAKKVFYGCGGLKINDDIRLTIAAEACLLLLNRQTDVYPGLQHILVYPHAFKTERKQLNSDGTVSEVEHGLLGESWGNGKVILSWDDVEFGAENFEDGHNVVLHEFSHQLDNESGVTNGAPPLRKNSYRVWAEVLSKEFQDLIKANDHQRKSVMDYYGATNPAEFFAVATETFFEKPKQMSKKHPELFDELKTYYCVDPGLWQ